MKKNIIIVVVKTTNGTHMYSFENKIYANAFAREIRQNRGVIEVIIGEKENGKKPNKKRKACCAPCKNRKQRKKRT